MLAELGHMLDAYVGGKSRGGHAVYIAPQDDAQATALSDTMPALEKEQRPGGEVFRVGSYHSLAYAELVCGWYRDAGYTTTVENERGAVDAAGS